MRHFLFIILLLVLALFCGALLAYPVYEFLQLITEVRFHKLLSYTSSLCGLLLICAWLKHYGQLNRNTLGYCYYPAPSILRQSLAGLAVGVAVMTVLFGMLLALGVFRFESGLEFSLARGIYIFISALIAGALVGWVEETLYRGALLGGLLARMSAPGAILISSIVFSSVHFLKFKEVPSDLSISWDTGIAMLPGAFYLFSDPSILDAFLSLLAFGILLSMARLKYGAIYLCMGLHAGVVASTKMLNKITEYAPDNTLAFLVSQHDRQLGLLTLFWLTVCIVIFYRSPFRHGR